MIRLTNILACILFGVLFVSALGSTRFPEGAVATSEGAQLKDLKVASFFQSYVMNHPVEESVQILRDTSTQIVFRGFYRWNKRDPSLEAKLGNVLESIKRELPATHFMGAISLRQLILGDTWPNGTILSSEVIKQIVFTLPNGTMWLGPAAEPIIDISKPLARTFVVGWANLEVDAGVDSIFFDEVEYAARRKAQMGLLDGLSEYYEYWGDIVTQLKTYAMSKYARRLLITMNQGWINPIGEKPYMDIWPYQDFISISFCIKTVRTFHAEDDWPGLRERIWKAYRQQLPIISFLDYGTTSDTPFAVFVNMPLDQQVKMLQILHESAVQNGVIFAYPLASSSAGIGERGGMEYYAMEEGAYDAIRILSNSLLGRTVNTLTLTSIATTSETQSGISEMYQDNGRVSDVFYAWYKSGSPRQLAVRFLPPSEVRLIAAKIMIPDWMRGPFQTVLEPFILHVLDSSFNDLIRPLGVSPSRFGWTIVDLESHGITTKKLFAISVEYPQRAHTGEPSLGVGLDNGKPFSNQTYYRSANGMWLDYASLRSQLVYWVKANALIRAIVSKPITVTSRTTVITTPITQTSHLPVETPISSLTARELIGATAVIIVTIALLVGARVRRAPGLLNHK